MRPAIALLSMLWVLLTALIGPAITIPPGQRISGNVSTYTENIRVDGDVSGNVTSWSGNIIINGSVGGDVVSYTGSIHLMSNARVAGSVMTLSGQLQDSSFAQVRGQQFSSVGVGRIVRPVVGIFTSTTASASGLSQLALASTSTIFGLLVLASVLSFTSIWPGRNHAAALILQKTPVRSFLLGLLIVIAMASLAPLVIAALASTVIGLPVALLIVLLVNSVCAYGLAVLIQSAFLSLKGKKKSKHILSPYIVAITIALILPIMLIGLVAPLPALLLFYLIACPGLGATALQGSGVGE